MKFIIAALLALSLSACATTYKAERTGANGETLDLYVRSYREFPGGVDLRYNRETGEFEFQAGEVRNDDAMAQLLISLLPLIPKP